PVPDNRRLLAHRAFDAAIALRKPPAEIVDGRVGVHANRIGIRSKVRAGVDARGPALEVVPLERLPEIDADLRRIGDLFEGDAPLDADAAKVRTESVACAHGD